MPDLPIPNQFVMQNPVTQYPMPPFPAQQQRAPGLAAEMSPKPDHGEKTYVGTGRLAGRKALVTGADSGIGRAVAIAFAREGADVVLNYLPAEERDALEVVALIRDAGRQAHAMPGDLTDEAFCRGLARRAHAAMGGLDIVANIAGAQGARTDIGQITSAQFDHTFRTNVYALFWLCQEALPLLPPGATIINTTSIQAYQPSPQLLDYAATKGAIATFTVALAKQAIQHGVRVNAVAPGPVWTPLQPAGGQPPDALPHFGHGLPYKRPGQPAEVAPIYVALASQETSFVTGEVFGVTGGVPTP